MNSEFLFTRSKPGEGHCHDIRMGVEAVSPVGGVQVPSVSHHKGTESKTVFWNL